MPEIKVNVSPEGKLTVEADGYKGKSCTEATKFLREALGEQEQEKKKAAYYETGTTGTSQKEKA